ncbi:hypothetical protein R3P38DRAFT_3175009 [Favolaschia claudopus]|uniref:Uncharacterized protein n=1 Tax=Favolaschia claudopus TaxID=2862362 RepID=A0AAW0DDU8_9AGAR
MATDYPLYIVPEVRRYNPEVDSEYRPIRGRIYSPEGSFFISIPTICATSEPFTTYACLQAAMNHHDLQPKIHHADAYIRRRLPSGRQVVDGYICFFKRHQRLPLNPHLNVRGEVVIMRAHENNTAVTDIEESEAHLVDLVAAALVPSLRAFQSEKRTMMEGFTVNSPDLQ